MFESSTTQPPKIISLAATALAAEKTWLLQCLKAPLRNLPSLSGLEGGIFQPKSRKVISYEACLNLNRIGVRKSLCEMQYASNWG